MANQETSRPITIRAQDDGKGEKGKVLMDGTEVGRGRIPGRVKETKEI